MFENYKKLLSEVLKFRSISTDASFGDEIAKAVAWYKNVFETNGFSVQVIEGYDNPLIVASYGNDPSLKTVLIYGHYDVQPARREEGWNSEPFELSEHDNRLYGRGVIDNKGQNLVHLVTVLEHIGNKTLGYNVKFFIEGGEEIGSPRLEQFMHDHEDIMDVDFVLLSDGEMALNTPVIEIGFRGIFNATLFLSVGTTDLHSGTYGGVAPNAIHELSKIIAQFYKQDNRVFSDALYEGAVRITQEMKENSRHIPFSEEEYRRVTGRKALFLEKDLDAHLRTGLMPSIEVTGISGGYSGEGYRNAIPYTASAKINVRLSPTQEPKAVFEKFKNTLARLVPAYADFELSYDQYNKGTLLDVRNDYVQRAAMLMERVWNTKPVFKYVGGSLPIVTLFNDVLKIPLVLAPLVNEDCNMHGANENFDVAYLEKAMAFSKRFFAKA